MRLSILALAFACSVLAAPTEIGKNKVHKHENKKPGSYIVTLKPGKSKHKHITSADLGEVVTHGDWSPDFINGYSATLSDSALKKLIESPDVESIEEDGIVSLSYTVTKTNAPWGISRLSRNTKQSKQNPYALNYTYKYDSTAGKGVDIYIIDTGVYTAHSEFGVPSRAKWGKTFGPYPSHDGHGHGTHCAGTAAGARYGVAKAASIIAVKVLSDAGQGSISDVIAGMNWVLAKSKVTGRPSIASMSLGGGISPSLDTAVAKLTYGGVHVIVAAGNSAANANNYSPARAPSAVTVGATTIADTFSPFSNYGFRVDILAPGSYVTSAWIGSPNAKNTISGTSMATPHVSGLVAYLIRLQGNKTPAAMATKLKSMSVKNAIKNLPAGTVNYLARNNIV